VRTDLESEKSLHNEAKIEFKKKEEELNQILEKKRSRASKGSQGLEASE
jgi:hypothetical protein